MPEGLLSDSPLKSIFNNLHPEDDKDTLVVIFVAETDPDFVLTLYKSIKADFQA